MHRLAVKASRHAGQRQFEIFEYDPINGHLPPVGWYRNTLFGKQHAVVGRHLATVGWHKHLQRWTAVAQATGEPWTRGRAYLTCQFDAGEDGAESALDGAIAWALAIRHGKYVGSDDCQRVAFPRVKR